MYEYRAQIVRVVDGDTLEMNIELGLGVIKTKERIHLAGIDAPEKHTPAGDQAIMFIEQFIGQNVTVRTMGDRKDKWQRYIGDVIVEYNFKDASLSDLLIYNGYAAAYEEN